MAATTNFFRVTMLMLGLLMIISLDFTDGQVGVCLGRLGNNLPSPATTVSLYKQYNIRRMRLYDPHPPTLRALSGSNIELMLGVPHADLRALANCPETAIAWVRANVSAYPNVTFRYISVGNEIGPETDLAPFILPAMQNLRRAIRAAGLGGKIRVSTSIIPESFLETSYPPQAGRFKCSVNWYIRPILEFLRVSRAPLLVNIYPIFAYMNDPKNINLSFALLQPNSGVVAGGVYYDNLFYAMLDAVHAAIEKIFASSSSSSFWMEDSGGAASDVGTTVSETSGPGTVGGGKMSAVDDGYPNTLENARIYINNLMRIVKTGTPKRPNRPIETYIFAMFDENQKPGPRYERHFGLFYPNGQPKFPFRFSLAA